MITITALTSCCVDVYPDLDKVYVGGNSLNFATQCKVSGIADVSIIGAVGKDPFSIPIEQHLDSYGIDRTRLYKSDHTTASNTIYIDEEGDRYFKSGSWQGGAFDAFRLSEDDWQFLKKTDIIAMPAGDPNLKELLNRRKAQTVIIDFLDYFPLDFIEGLIDSIDIVFISAKRGMLDSLNSLAIQSGKMIVATLGSEGSVAFHNHLRYVQEAIAVDEVVDTTGCGDAFQAAFAIEWYRTLDISKALYRGSLAAKKVLSFVGGVPGN